MVFDKIDLGEYVLIKDKYKNLNVVVKLEQSKNNIIDVVVITVMKKENFVAKTGTKVVEI